VHHVVTGALVQSGRLLLAHRSPGRRWYPDVWDLPGGHVHAGEEELTALRRELVEELGIEAVDVVEEPVVRISDPASALELGMWVVRGWIGTPTNAAPDEHDEIRWVGARELASLELAHAGYVTLLTNLLTA
jgi:8-oxo-dGTP diphosphatase